MRAMSLNTRPKKLSDLSHRASLSYRTISRVLDQLLKQGLVTIVDEAPATADWYQGDGMRHKNCVIEFS